jgi:hypothetical protein
VSLVVLEDVLLTARLKSERRINASCEMAASYFIRTLTKLGLWIKGSALSASIQPTLPQ